MFPVITFSIAAIPILILQIGLILGFPWGKLAMGGKFGSVFSPKLRVSAAIQLVIILISFLVVLIRGGILFHQYFSISKIAIWCVVVLYLISAILNTVTSSKYERLLGVPTTVTMCVSSIFIALN